MYIGHEPSTSPSRTPDHDCSCGYETAHNEKHKPCSCSCSIIPPAGGPMGRAETIVVSYPHTSEPGELRRRRPKAEVKPARSLPSTGRSTVIKQGSTVIKQGSKSYGFARPTVIKQGSTVIKQGYGLGRRSYGASAPQTVRLTASAPETV